MEIIRKYKEHTVLFLLVVVLMFAVYWIKTTHEKIIEEEKKDNVLLSFLCHGPQLYSLFPGIVYLVDPEEKKMCDDLDKKLKEVKYCANPQLFEIVDDDVSFVPPTFKNTQNWNDLSVPVKFSTTKGKLPRKLAVNCN